MDTKSFIDRVVPSGGHYFIGMGYTSPAGKKGIKQIKVGNKDNIESEITKLASQNKDIYIAIGSFINGDKRLKTNIKSKKAFYLDLDCGTGKPFPDKTAAIKELRNFVAQVGLPFPNLLVDSGNGIHAYYTLKDPIDNVSWTKMALKLKKLCHQFGFPADDACTADSARILRVPGTLNFKDPASPKMCRVLLNKKDTGILPLQKLLLGSVPLRVIQGGADAVTNADLGGGLEAKNYSQPLAQQVFDKCPTMKHALDTGGKDDSQPLWSQLLFILAYCSDGRDYIHEVSSQHPDYTSEETEKKYEEKLTAIVKKQVAGPTSCDNFGMTGGTQCHICPLRGAVKNPLLAVNFRSPTDLPWGYRMIDGGMEREVQLKGESEGVTEWVVISKWKFLEATVNKPPGEQTTYLRFKHCIGQGDEEVAEMTIKDLNEITTFKDSLGDNNIAMQFEEVKEAQRMLTTWSQQMLAAKCVSDAPNKMGWTKSGGKEGFALAQKILWEDGKETPNPLPSPELLKHYTPTGDLAPWKKAAELITTHPNVELHVALASSFAAPLMQMTNTHGAVLAIVSQASGIGKSKALHTAQAVWGKPNQINSMDDTGNSMIRKMGILNNLPAYWDELHMDSNNGASDSFTNTLFRLAQGKEKTRLTSNIKFQSSGEWTTLITVVSNDSIKDHLMVTRQGTDAAQMRVLELEITHAAKSNGKLDKALNIFGKMDSNYGCAGEEYSKYIVKNHEALRKRVTKTIANLSNLPNIGQAERMRIALIAAIIIGANAANDCGLTNFDVKAMTARMLKEIRPMLNSQGKVIPNSTGTRDMISAYIEAHAQNINKTDEFASKGNSLNVVIISQPHILPVRVHIADNLNRVRVEEAHLRQWLTQVYGGGSRTIQRLKAETGVTESRASLSYGLPSHINSRPRIIEMPLP